jgi:hypothetical protein
VTARLEQQGDRPNPTLVTAAPQGTRSFADRIDESRRELEAEPVAFIAEQAIGSQSA